MALVKHILERKGNEVTSVSPDESVYNALKIMAEKNIGAVLVLEDGNVAGIFSERDYARKIVLTGKASKETPVKDIMTAKVAVVSPDKSIEECMFIMTEKHFRHLPVMHDEKLVGLISIGDVVHALIDKKQFIINELVKYIQGYTHTPI